MLCVMAFAALAAPDSNAQTARTSVRASEINGTFRHSFPAKFKRSSSDIKIWALGHGKIKIAFDLIYPHLDGNGDLTANTGEGGGEATISGDTAVYESAKFGPCKITITFVRPGTIKVDQDGTDTDCGFGHDVTANGVFRKISSAKPKFGS